MEEMDVVETEWGGELHRQLIAEEQAARVAWRNSPEAWEQVRRMREAEPLRWGRVISYVKHKKTPIFRW